MFCIDLAQKFSVQSIGNGKKSKAFGKVVIKLNFCDKFRGDEIFNFPTELLRHEAKAPINNQAPATDKAIRKIKRALIKIIDFDFQSRESKALYSITRATERH